jgi:hypothetical protein
VGEEHLDLLATMPGLFIFGGGGNRSGDIAGIFVKITRYLAGDGVCAATLFEVAGVTVLLAGAVESPSVARDP